MKTPKIILLGIALALPTLLSAQENAEKALDKFVKGLASDQLTLYSNDVEDRETDTYRDLWGFSLPKRDKKKITALTDGFHKDISKAYIVFRKEAGSNPATHKVSYGKNGQHTIRIGGSRESNCLMLTFRDPDDSQLRTVYALEWEEKDNKLIGTINKIHSADPQRNRTQTTAHTSTSVATSVVTKPDGTVIVTNGNGETITVSGNGDVTQTTADGKVHNIVTTKSDGSQYIDMSRLNQLGKLSELGKVTRLNTEALDALSSPGFPFNTGTDFDDDTRDDASTSVLSRFGNMRAAYLKAVTEQEDTDVLTALANSIVSLVRTKGDKLSADEKNLCREGLKEMKQRTTDTFIKGLFDIGVKELGK